MRVALKYQNMMRVSLKYQKVMRVALNVVDVCTGPGACRSWVFGRGPEAHSHARCVLELQMIEICIQKRWIFHFK